MTFLLSGLAILTVFDFPAMFFPDDVWNFLDFPAVFFPGHARQKNFPGTFSCHPGQY